MIDPFVAMMLTDKVIEIAPKIANGAQILWNKARRKTPLTDQRPIDDVASVHKSKHGTDAEPELRNAWAEAAIGDLHSEMLASTDLIKALADQQAQFAKYIEATRQQLETVDKQNQQFAARLELDQLSIKALEDQNIILVKRSDVDRAALKTIEEKYIYLSNLAESERARVSRLNNICIAIGLMAATGIAMVLRLSSQ